jgi:hypothetical protein
MSDVRLMNTHLSDTFGSVDTYRLTRMAQAGQANRQAIAGGTDLVWDRFGSKENTLKRRPSRYNEI